MAKEKAPAFQFYPRDFMGDLNVQAMDWDERGVYFWLLCLCWCEERIPADPAELANICRIPQRKFSRIWDRVGRCFTSDQDGMLRHARLDTQRKHYEDFIDRCSHAGKRSAQIRAERRKVGSSSPQASLDEGVTDPAVHATIPQPLLEAFERWIAEYPNAVRVDTALQSWLSLITLGEITEETLPDVFAGLRRWKRSRAWAEEDGKYIPAPHVFLTGNARHTGRLWKDQPPESAETRAAERSATRSRDGVDPNSEWIAPWEET